MDLALKPTTNIEFSFVHAAFLEAFKNYYIPMECPQEVLQSIFDKNGVDSSLSVGAFDSRNKLVGFTFLAVGEIKGHVTAYLNVMGIIPSFRGKSLAQRMIDFFVPKVKQQGCTSVTLEVIDANQPALKAYRKAGFEITRILMSYRAHGASVRLPLETSSPITITEIPVQQLSSYSHLLTWQPCWENLLESALRTNQAKAFGAFSGGECVGYILYHLEFLQIMQLTGRDEVLSLLLKEVFTQHQVPGLSYLGVDSKATTDIEFLTKVGFEPFMKQFEMELSL